MGLDIMHYKLTLEPEDKQDYLVIDNWDEECNVPFNNYEQYITDIQEFDFDINLLLVANNQDLELLKQSVFFNASSYRHIFIGKEKATMQQEINTYIKKQKLDKLERSGLEFNNGEVVYNTISFGHLVTKKAMCFNVIGDQNKGMNTHFYNTYKKYDFWGKQEDFNLAYKCIGREHDTKDLIKWNRTNFKRDFLDTYEFGKSLLCASF